MAQKTIQWELLTLYNFLKAKKIETHFFGKFEKSSIRYPQLDQKIFRLFTLLKNGVIAKAPGKKNEYIAFFPLTLYWNHRLVYIIVIYRSSAFIWDDTHENILEEIELVKFLQKNVLGNSSEYSVP